MANDINNCTFTGRLGKDPESKALPSGDMVTNFSIAVGKQWKDKSGDKKEETSWLNIVAFGKLAEICAEWLKKGQQIAVVAQVRVRQYADRDGNNRYATEFVAEHLTMIGGKSDSDGGGRDSNNGGSQPRQQQRPAQQNRPAQGNASAKQGGFDEVNEDIPF